MSATPILSPASFVPSHAAAFAAPDGTSLLVSTSNPLPVTLAVRPTNTPLSGTATANGLFGPLALEPGQPAILVLSGNWAGTVRITRSTDGGTTRLPLTVAGTSWGVYTAPCCEAVWEESQAGAALYLEVTLNSGTLIYRLGQ